MPACCPDSFPVSVFSQVMILSISADGLGAVVSALLGLRVAPHFDNPYGSTSSQ